LPVEVGLKAKLGNAKREK
jgi:hypothetical protein